MRRPEKTGINSRLLDWKISKALKLMYFHCIEKENENKVTQKKK